MVHCFKSATNTRREHISVMKCIGTPPQDGDVIKTDKGLGNTRHNQLRRALDVSINIAVWGVWVGGWQRKDRGWQVINSGIGHVIRTFWECCGGVGRGRAGVNTHFHESNFITIQD